MFILFLPARRRTHCRSRSCVKSFQSVICHQHSHMQTDECGACEFFTGGSKLLLVGGADGKIDIGQVEALLARQNELAFA